MPISFECDQCRRAYQVSEDLAGKRGRCKQCGHVFTVPAGTGPTPDDLYALDDADERSAHPQDDAPVAPASPKKKKKAKRASGLPGISSLPPVGVQIYRGVIFAVLVASLVVGGVPKLVLALGGTLLCVGPFVMAGFSYRFGVAFRDGPIAGLLYMFFFPYRIHYRLTHQELFRTLRAPALTLQDYSLLVLGVLFLPVILLAAQEVDKLPKERPAPPAWARLLPKAPAQPVPGAPPAVARPDRTGPLRGGIDRRPKAEPVEPPANAADPAPAGPSPEEPPPSRPARPRFNPNSARPKPERLGRLGVLPPPGPRFRPGPEVGPNITPPPGPAARPGYGPEVTATITVEGPTDPSASKRYNDAIVSILKGAGGGWSLGSSTIGGKVTFTAAPIPDLRAFADKIDFGKVTRVEDRSIDVEAGP